MKTNKHLMLAALALTLVLLAAAGVAAAGARGAWGGSGGGPAGCFGMYGPGMGGYAFWASLQLNDQQIAKIQSIQKDNYEKMKALRDQLQDLMFSLQQMRFQKTIDQSAWADKLQQVAKLREQMVTQQQQAWKQIQSVLTKEQLDKLNSLRPGRNYGPGRGGRGGRGGWGGFGGCLGGGMAPWFTTAPDASGTSSSGTSL